MSRQCPPEHKHAETGTCHRHHGCRCLPCRARANSRTKLAYRVRRDVTGGNRRISSLGVARRLQALATLGWSVDLLATHLGMTHMQVSELRARKRANVYLSTHKRVAEMYRELAFVPAMDRGRASTQVALHAKRKGWAPPLAWDDIDNPRERPKGV